MTIIEIDKRFPTELDCITYLEKLRWGKTVKCAYCKSTNLHPRAKDHRFHCADCKKSFGVTVNTAIHNTRLPLKTWIYAIGLITDAKKGMSALQLQRNLGVHYETAFNMYHIIRDLMEEENEKMPKLKGVVEMDETFVGGKPRKAFPTKGKFLRREERDKFDAQKAEMESKGFVFRA